MNVQKLKRKLAPLRGEWDLEILASLAPDGSGARPGELIRQVSAQSGGRRLHRKVLAAALRRLEAGGYVSRREVAPRHTRYALLPAGHRLLAALSRLEAWYDSQDGGGDGHADPPGRDAA